MKIIHNLNMDLARCGCKPVVVAVQGEANTRTLVVSLYDNGVAWEIPETAAVEVAFQKPDGTRGIYSKLPDGTAATSFVANELTAILAPQVLTSPGSVRAAFVFHKGDDEIVATFPFIITVDPSPAAGAELSEDYYNPSVGDMLAVANELTNYVNNTMARLPDQVEALTLEELAAAKASGEFDGPKGDPGDPGVYILAEGETLADAPLDAEVVIDPNGESEVPSAVNITSVTESDEDGGSNVIEFSDGTKVVVKNGNAGYTPVKGVDYCTEADKEEMVEAVQEVMEGIPDYWQTALDNGVNAINTAIETAGRNKSAFLFYTDAHWGYGSGMSPTLLKYLGKHTAINKTIFGGDFGNTYEYPDTGKTMDDWMDVMRSWKLAVRDIPNHHSVVGNHDDDVTALANSKALYGFLFAPEETSDIVRGGDFFYYIDDPNEQTRYIYLDTGLGVFDDAQCEFVIDALATLNAGWHVVAVSHIWFVYDSTDTPTVGSVPANTQKLLALFDAYNSRSSGSVTLNADHAYDFSGCGGWVEFCIGGHTHVDYHFTSEKGIPVILCQTDSKHLRGGEYTYTAGTTTEAAVSGIVADYDAKKISIVRVGRGTSRELEITWYEVSYTNVLTLAIDKDGTPFQGGKGYAAESRIGSGGLYVGGNANYVTGFIPIDSSQDVTLRLKNVCMLSDSAYADSNIAFALFDSSFARVQYIKMSVMLADYNNEGNQRGCVFDGNNLVQFTIRAGADMSTDAKYLALCCDLIDDTSIITINEPID